VEFHLHRIAMVFSDISNTETALAGIANTTNLYPGIFGKLIRGNPGVLYRSRRIAGLILFGSVNVVR